MKNSVERLTRKWSWVTLFSILVFSACNEAEFISVIQFSESKQNVVEGSEATIKLTLNRATGVNESIHVTLETNAIYGQHYTTEPELKNGSLEITVLKGQNTAEIKVKTIDNGIFENSRFIIFSLNNPNGGLRLGNMVNYLLTIDDDEGPSIVNFVVDNGTVNEKEENGIVVQLSLSAPSKGSGSIVISVNPGNASYKQDFDTSPHLVNNTITLDIHTNETTKSFTVFPIHNFLFTPDYKITFTITSVFGVVHKGNNLSYSLILKNEDEIAIVSFDEGNGTVNENDTEGIAIQLNFSEPIKKSCVIYITSEDIINRCKHERFLTYPDIICSYGCYPDYTDSGYDCYIRIPISEGATSAQFIIKPINNAVKDTKNTFEFYIADYGNASCLSPAPDSKFVLTIVDDD